MSEEQLRLLMMTASFDELEKVSLTWQDWQALERMADNLMQRLAMISGYAAARGADGCGANGHEEGMKEAHAREKAVRKALGYLRP